jgi:hypothetical protein
VDGDADDLMVVVVVEEDHAADGDTVSEHVAVPAAVRSFVVGTAAAAAVAVDPYRRRTVFLGGRMRGGTERVSTQLANDDDGAA